MKFLTAAIILASLTATPALAHHTRHHHRHHHHAHVWQHPYGIDYSHNYGPGMVAGTFAYYDGPLSVRCDQSAAAYRGQDGRRHPCN
jgi:hypothetical protein